MIVRSNKSTELRPHGARVLDAPQVTIDLNESIKNIMKEETWKSGDKNAITLYKTDGMTIVLIALREGGKMDRHQARGVISVHVLKGTMKFGTDTNETELSEGEIVTLHKGVMHSVEALKKCVFLLTVAG